MTRFSWVLIFFSFSLIAQVEPLSLSCSKNGTYIIYINGIDTISTKAAADSDRIRQAIQGDLKRYDSNSMVDVDYEHNFSEGLARDLAQLIEEKLAGQKFSKDQIEDLLPYYFFMQDFFNRNVPYEMAVEVKMKEIEFLTKQKYQSLSDIRRIASRIKTMIEVGVKVIVVSHSQGNIYANEAYAELLRLGVSRQLLDKYYANFQVGSVAAFTNAKNFRLMTFNYDTAVNYLRTQTPATIQDSNYELANPLACQLELCHYFSDVYLSTSLEAYGPKQGSNKISRSAVEIFRDGLEEVAWMLANNDENCCNGKDGRFYRADYDSAPQKGFVGSDVSITNTTLTIDDDSQICGNVSIGLPAISNSQTNESDIILVGSHIYGSPEDFPTNVYVSGSLQFADTFIEPLLDELDLKIRGNTNEMLRMESTEVSLNGEISGSMVVINSELTGEGDISGFRHKLGTDDWNYPLIEDATIDDTDVYGFYSIEGRKIWNSLIAAGPVEFTSHWGMTTIGPNSQDLDDVSILGLVTAEGKVGFGSVLEGYRLSSTEGGISVRLGSSVVEATDVRGGAVIQSGASIMGEWISMQLTPSGGLGTITGGALYETYIMGPALISSSNITWGNISGDNMNCPQISGSNLHLAHVSGNAIIIGENTSGRYYEQGYVTGALDKMISMDGMPGQSGFAEATEKFKKRNGEILSSIDL